MKRNKVLLGLVVVVVEAVDGREVGRAGLRQLGEGEGVGVEAEDTFTLARHASIVGGVLDVAIAGADEDSAIGSLEHIGDREDDFAIVDDVGDMVPDGGVGKFLHILLAIAKGGVELANKVAFFGAEEESTIGSTGKLGCAGGVAAVDHYTGYLAGDVGGTHFIEFASCFHTGLGVCGPSGQSHQAYNKAEQYFVSFHK